MSIPLDSGTAKKMNAYHRSHWCARLSSYAIHKRILLVVCFSFGMYPAQSALAAPYSDVWEKHENARAIEYMHIHKIMNGYPNGTFGTDIPVNRAELMKILVDAGPYPDIVAYQGRHCFSDVLGSEWFAPYVCFAAEHGWVKGYADGTFRPDRKVNFAEALKMIEQVRFNFYNKNPYVKREQFFLQHDYEKNWYDPYMSNARSLGMITEEGTFSRDGQSIDGPVPRKRIAEILYRLFLAEERVRWPVEMSHCTFQEAISAEMQGYTSAEYPNARPSEGLRLIIREVDGRTCLLADDMNPYSRITKDYGEQKVVFFQYSDDPTDSQVLSMSTFLLKNVAYLIGYISDGHSSRHVWRLDLNRGELTQVPGNYLDFSGLQITKDYKYLIYATQLTIEALNLETGEKKEIDRVDDPYLMMMSIDSSQTGLVKTTLPAKVRVDGDEVRYAIYKVEPGGNVFDGPFVFHEERVKKISEFFTTIDTY